MLFLSKQVLLLNETGSGVMRLNYIMKYTKKRVENCSRG